MARRIKNLELKITEVDDVAFLKPDVDVDRLIGLIEHLSQHGEVIAERDLVGREAMGCDDGPPCKKMRRADVIQVFMGQNDHVQVFRLAGEVSQTLLDVRIGRSQANIDQHSSRCAPDEISIGRTAFEAELINILRCFGQGKEFFI